MGAPKATLPFGDESLLERVARLAREVVSTIVVVAATGQELPPLPGEFIMATDREPERGPLEGIAAGLAALPSEIEAAYVTSCDVPLLAPAFIERMFQLLDDYEIAVPRDEPFHHPLAAVYRPRVLASVRSLLAEDRLRPVYLFEREHTRETPVAELRAVDPELRSLLNLNRPADYFAALAMAGLEIDPNTRRMLAGKLDTE